MKFYKLKHDIDGNRLKSPPMDVVFFTLTEPERQELMWFGEYTNLVGQGVGVRLRKHQHFYRQLGNHQGYYGPMPPTYDHFGQNEVFISFLKAPLEPGLSLYAINTTLIAALGEQVISPEVYVSQVLGRLKPAPYQGKVFKDFWKNLSFAAINIPGLYSLTLGPTTMDVLRVVHTHPSIKMLLVVPPDLEQFFAESSALLSKLSNGSRPSELKLFLRKLPQGLVNA
jgi:hypothetical protein